MKVVFVLLIILGIIFGANSQGCPACMEAILKQIGVSALEMIKKSF